MADGQTVFDNISRALIGGVGAFGDYLHQVGFVAQVDKLEALVRGALYDVFPDGMKQIDGWLAEPHPYAKALDFPLMNPFWVILLMIGYLITVFSLKAFMRNRERFELKTFSLIHNTGLVLLSAFMCFEALRNAFFVMDYGLFGNAYSDTPKEYGMARIVWIFYVSKIWEFVDTFIMALKKNDRQISFLHCYHHMSIFPIWWLTSYFYPAGEAYFSIAQNSFVHVVMYSYYIAASRGIHIPWKYYITYIQMLQFFMNIVQAVTNVYILKVEPTWLMHLLLWYMVTLLILFGNYLRVNMGKKKGGKGGKKDSKKTDGDKSGSSKDSAPSVVRRTSARLRTRKED